jgi:hypothetical protein
MIAAVDARTSTHAEARQEADVVPESRWRETNAWLRWQLAALKWKED